MSMNLIVLLYLVASVCFIQALKGLSHPTTSIRGNVFGMTGMAIAALTTVALIFMLRAEVGLSGLIWVLLGLLIGGTAGAVMAKRVEMTKMPELVAFMHSMIGLAAVCIAVAAAIEPWAFGITEKGGLIPAGNRLELALGAGIGAITFNGPVGGTTKPYNLILTGGNVNINATTQAMNVTMTGGNLNWNADIISPGFGTPGVPYGYHTFVGTINLLRNVTIEGNIGLINGTREYTTPRTVGGFTLTPRYNEDPVIVVPAEDPPNLLNNQLNMNQLAGSVPADLAPPSGPTPPPPEREGVGP